MDDSSKKKAIHVLFLSGRSLGGFSGISGGENSVRSLGKVYEYMTIGVNKPTSNSD